MKKGLIGLFLVCFGMSTTVAAQATEKQPFETESSSEDIGERSNTPISSECTPKCREGYTCSGGRCVSVCNPPCGPDQTCTSLGHCVSSTESQSITSDETVVPQMIPDQPGHYPELGPGDSGWAYAAGIIGLISTAAVVGLTAGSAWKHGESESAYLGIGALGTLAISGPVVAIGALSARTNPIHRGYPAVYTLSWIGYALTLVYGTALCVDGMETDDVKPGWIAGAGVLGTLTLVGFSVDAFASAIQAESPVGQLGTNHRKPSIRPHLTLLPHGNGLAAATLGIGGVF